jgi:hypothetical protein
LAKVLNLLVEVNGGGKELRTDWKEGLTATSTMKEIRDVGEQSVKNCYGTAINGRVARCKEARSHSQ